MTSRRSGSTGGSRRLCAALALTLALMAGFFVAPSAEASHGADVVIEGRGWGHGLGLGQWGARGQGERGESFQNILTRFYQGTAVSSHPAPYDPLRIGLTWDQGTISGSTTNGGSVSCPTGQSGPFGIGAISYSAVNTPSGTVGQLRDGGGGVIINCPGALTLSYAPGSLRLTGHEYRRGYLELSVKPSTMLVRAIAMINGIGPSPAIDVYLWGLGEMPSSWPSEALKSQAVAGRTYALEKIARLGQHRTSPACDCALVATTGDQAYVGYDKEAGASGSRWVDAVESTRWLAVLSNGAPVEAYYHSSSGGHTEHNELAWGGTPRSYLRGVSDPYDATGGNPHASWSVRFSWHDLEARLNSNEATSVGTLRSFEIVPPLGVSGRVTVVLDANRGGVRITGSAATKRVSGDKVRSVLGLKSTLFSSTETPPSDTKTEPAGGYTLRSNGDLVPFGVAPAAVGAPSLPGSTARALAIGGPSGTSGYVLSAYGSLHPVNGASPATGAPSWPGWDIARDVALRSDGSSGYVLDGWGGVHPFGGAPFIGSSFYAEGQDVAKRVELRADGTSGYVVTADGGVHAIGGAPAVSWSPLDSPRFPTGLTLRADGASGYVIDDAGGLHAFGGAPDMSASLGGTVSGVGRSDGESGYVVTSDGAVNGFGGAPAASTSVGGVDRRDMALIDQPQGYALDGWGGLHSFGGAPGGIHGGPYWPGWDIARGLAVRPDSGGYVLDGWGGVHPFATGSQPLPPSVAHPYWPGWDIARDLVLLPGSPSAGYVLDGYGGIHAFGGAPAARATGYWSGWDIARRLALNPNGTGGYVLDGWGGLHPFAVGSNPMPPFVAHPYWPGWDIARGVALTGTASGWVVDGYGGVHPFGGTTGGGSWYWLGRDYIVGAEAGGPGQNWVFYVDRSGGIHTAPPAAPAVDFTGYFPGFPIVRDLAVRS